MSESTGKSKQPGDLPAETLSNRLEELNRQIAASMETAVRELHQDISRLASEAGSSGQKTVASSLLEAFARIDGEESQSGILTTLLVEGRRFASRTAFFLLRSDQVVAWASRGFGDSDDTIAGRSIEGGHPWNLLAENGASLPLDNAACEAICKDLDVDPGNDAILIPFVIRGQLGGALYADRLQSDDALLTEGLQLLTHSASQAVDLVAVSHRGTSPALRLGEDRATPTKLPVWQPGQASQEQAADSSPPQASDDAPEEAGSPEDAESPRDAVEPATDPVAEDAESATASGGQEGAADDALVDDTSAQEPETDPVMAGPVVEMAEPSFDEPSFDEPSLDEPSFDEPEVSDEPSFDEPTVSDEPTIIDEPAGEVDTPFAFAEQPAAELGSAEPDVSAELSEPTLEPEPTFAEPTLIEEPAQPTFAEPTLFADEDSSFDPTQRPEASPADLDTAGDGFDGDDPTAVDLTHEAIPEPELEDTNTDIWSLEEEDEDDDDDEPTLVGLSVIPPSPAAEPETSAQPDIAESAPPLAADSVGQETVRLDIAALGRAASFAAEPAAPEPAAPEPVAPEPVAPEPAAPEPPAPQAQTSFAQPQTAYVPPPVVATPAPTEAPPPPSFDDASPSGGFVPPPEPKQEAPAAGGDSNEVRPPDGHQGPGLAFASAPGSDGALHEEARRLARLLVSEIKLYNEEIIEEGKRQGDIYGRLRDDIDRSRQMYQERIDPKLQGKDDYFYQELVQRLAGGDASLLGMT